MKVRASVRSLARQPGAQVVRRHGKIFVINRNNPRIKARQG
ncbi:type B 50S ribosomal protein L36 [Amycolatopsis sp. FDAARGOS 1241]|nr:type B 50S ribosomal protein L36 [Amycolatopsis sp. FDAARGOS 1241]QRP49015.1 type B 50S ribosomal protein L36 [Amycolatopsis sp. FDAARGOS 1241]